MDSVENRMVLGIFNWSVVLGSPSPGLKSAERSQLLISDWLVKFWPKCLPHCRWGWHVYNLTVLSWTKFLLLVRCKMYSDFCPGNTSGVTIITGQLFITGDTWTLKTHISAGEAGKSAGLRFYLPESFTRLCSLPTQPFKRRE